MFYTVAQMFCTNFSEEDRGHCQATLYTQPGLPVSSDVSHEQDAGVHVEEEGRESKVAEDKAGGADVFCDADGETEA